MNKGDERARTDSTAEARRERDGCAAAAQTQRENRDRDRLAARLEGRRQRGRGRGREARGGATPTIHPSTEPSAAADSSTPAGGRTAVGVVIPRDKSTNANDGGREIRMEVTWCAASNRR